MGFFVVKYYLLSLLGKLSQQVEQFSWGTKCQITITGQSNALNQ